MGVAASQTVEDGEPRFRSDWTIHHAGTPREYLRIALAARLPHELHQGMRVVMRAYQRTGELTVTLEVLRIE